MSKKGISKFDRECPICGGVIWGKGQNVLLEGARIYVCQSCAQNGTTIYDSPTIKKSDYTPSKARSKKFSDKKDIVDEFEIVTDYAKRIKNARNSKNLNQDQFAQKLNEKPSLLKRIETGKMEPTIKLAKKIEQTFKIKLLKKVDEIEASIQSNQYMKKKSSHSLGDIAFIKKKK
ncbi:MAG: multiprotein bridging factor aMBF1 [Promethearchaeota archaeon]